MNPETIATVSATVGIALFGAVGKLFSDLATMKTDISWIKHSMIRMAENEITTRGYGFKASPLVVSPELRKMYDDTGLTRELQDFYKSRGVKLSDEALYVVIEKTFRTKLSTLICGPSGLILNGCVAAACSIATDGKWQGALTDDEVKC